MLILSRKENNSRALQWSPSMEGRLKELLGSLVVIVRSLVLARLVDVTDGDKVTDICFDSNYLYARVQFQSGVRDGWVDEEGYSSMRGEVHMSVYTFRVVVTKVEIAVSPKFGFLQRYHLDFCFWSSPVFHPSCFSHPDNSTELTCMSWILMSTASVFSWKTVCSPFCYLGSSLSW